MGARLANRSWPAVSQISVSRGWQSERRARGTQGKRAAAQEKGEYINHSPNLTATPSTTTVFVRKAAAHAIGVGQQLLRAVLAG
jgi:hypothetical protein